MKASHFIERPHQCFPGSQKAIGVTEEKERYNARMAYLEKACTIDTLQLVFAAVTEKNKKSIRGYAYLKIPARQFLQSLSEKQRTNPNIYHKNGLKIRVNFPVMESDKFQPNIIMKWKKVYKALTTTMQYTKEFYFPPIETLQMVGNESDQMTKEGFFQGIFLWLHLQPVVFKEHFWTFLIENVSRLNVIFERFLCWYREILAVRHKKTNLPSPKNPPYMTMIRVRHRLVHRFP